MGKKEKFTRKYLSGFAPNNESEGSGSSSRVDTEITASEDSNFPKRKCINLNSVYGDGFDVPIQRLPLSKLSPSERSDLVLRLKSELEKIKILRKKIESQRTNAAAVSSSNDILSCSNVRNLTSMVGLNKCTFMNSESGKKLNNHAQKGRGLKRDTSGRFESTKRPPPACTSNTVLMRQCENLLKKLMSHQYGPTFSEPVDIAKFNIPDYFTIIKKPMDLGTIKKKMALSQYSNLLDFAADVRLTFSNAMTYNPPGHLVHFYADSLSKFFEVRWKAIEKKLPLVNAQLEPESAISEKPEKIKPAPSSKKRKSSPVQQKIMPDPVKCVMTAEERRRLSSELEAILGELPEHIIEFLREQSSNGKEGEDDEIEVDIDDLTNDALVTLRSLLDDYLQKGRKKQPNIEPCDGELPNESGLSNLSVQICKENDPADEDVDIVGNEPPVSSCPHFVVEQDTRQTSNKSIPSASSSDSDSSSSESESECGNDSSPVKRLKGDTCPEVVLGESAGAGDLVDGNQSVSGLDQLELMSQQKPSSGGSDSCQDAERQVSPDKRYRAAVLKNRFADTILKAREKTITHGERGDPEKLRREREELELQRKKEKARLQAEAKAAEEARRLAEAEAVAEAKRKIEAEREAARQALLEMEKTVEINESSGFFNELAMLRAAPADLLPSSVDETSPDQCENELGSFNFGGSNPLEQLGLYMKIDEEEEEGEPPCSVTHEMTNDVEEGEID